MIPPGLQWCHQICVTSACWPKPACSNCTRLLGHENKRYFMTPDQFEDVLKVATPFVYHSFAEMGQIVNRARQGKQGVRRKKCLGIFGGEPLMHPNFPDLVDLMIKYIPQVANRGLWTSYDWVNGKHPKWGSYKDQVVRLLGPNPTGDACDLRNGYINWNMHEEHQKCEHSPVLAAAKDMIPDEKERWSVIKDCWVQTEWSAAYALNADNEPKFYFCEIASSFDRVFNLGTGLPLEDGVWSHHLWFAENEEGVMQPHGPYAEQILSTCNRCGAALQMKGRRDREFTDDISPSNLVELKDIKSPMVRMGQFNEVTSIDHDPSAAKKETPWEYLKDHRQQQNKNFQKASNSLVAGIWEDTPSEEQKIIKESWGR